MGKKILFITAAVFALLSCENPIQAGLGGKVDITVPVISMVSPRNVGDHVKGEFTLEVNAKDDVGVTKVQVAVIVDGEGNPLPETDWVWEEAVFNEATGFWTYPVDTTAYPDGDLPVRIKAEDATKKSVIFEGMYSSKNNPPEIELQVPAAPPEDSDHNRELVTGGVMIGIAKDLWGVAPGYPKIQFWHKDEGENPLDPSWHDMDSYAARSAEEWAASTSGKTALEFQYYAVNRTVNPDLPVRDMPGLMPGHYRYRFQAKDVDGTVATYPATGYDEMDVISVREKPEITVAAVPEDSTKPAGQYHRQPFYISAEVSHTTGIIKATIEVQKEGETESSILARGVYSDNVLTGSGVNTTMTRRLETYLIEPGQHYIQTDVESETNDIDAVADYEFTDGTYTFTIDATSVQSSVARQSLTVYIDTTAPDISITRVQPNVNPESSGLDEYTVNGFIAVDMSAYDVNNVGVDGDYRAIKYLITDAPVADPVALYDDPAAQYFDNPVAPVYKRIIDIPPRPPYTSTTSVIIDTTAFTPGPAYYTPTDKRLYLIAKDPAGNYNFTTALLKVDQNTDIPAVEITGFDFSQRSEAALAPPANPNTLGINREMSGTFKDDDGVLTAATGAAPGDVLFKIFPGGIGAGIDIPIVLKVPNGGDGKTVEFEATLPNDGTFPDGVYSVEIVIKDNVAKKNELKPGSLTDLPMESFNTTNGAGRIFFVLDTEPPSVTETIIKKDTFADPKLIWRTFNLEGTVADVNGLRSLEIVQTELGVEKFIEKFVYTAPDNKDKAWALPVDSLPQAVGDTSVDLRSGTFTYKITAEDIAGKRTVLYRWVEVDLDPPLLTVNPPRNGTSPWVSGSYTVVQGTETDYRTGPVFYSIQSAPSMVAVATDVFTGKATPADYLAAGWTELPVAGSGWTDNVLLDVGSGGLAEGIYFLYVAAFDSAGNLTTNFDSVPVTRVPTFGVDQAPPDLNDVKFTGVSDTDPLVWHVKDRFSLAGLLKDTYGLDSVILTEQRDSEPAITLNLTQNPHYPQTAGSDTSWSLAVPGLPWNHASTPDSNPPSGEYTYTLTVKDKTGMTERIATKTFTIVYDVTGPVVTIDNPALSADVSGTNVYISGSAPDTHTTNNVSVYYSIDTSPTYTLPANPAPGDFTSPTWTKIESVSWSDNPSLIGFGEGRAYLHVLAFDRLGNVSAVVNREFNIDTSPPKIEDWTVTSTSTPPYDPPVKVVDGSNYVTKDYTITFKVKDTNELRNKPGQPGLIITRNSVELIRTSDSIIGSTDTASGAGYSIAVTKSTSKEWSVTLTLTDQEQGYYPYSIVVYDVKDKQNTPDNNGDAANAYRNFNVWVDTVGPELIVAQPVSGSTTYASTLAIGGSAVDIHTPAGVRVYYAIDNNSAKPESYTPEDPGFDSGWILTTATTWPGSVPIPSFTTEGARHIHFVAYDKIGNKSAQVDRPFFVDLAAPHIKTWTSTDITTYSSSNLIDKDNFGFSFVAYDSNALKNVAVTRNGTPLFTATGAVPSGTGTGYTYTVTTNVENTEWTVSLNLTGQADSVYDYGIEIRDIADRANLPDNTPDLTKQYKTFSVRIDTEGPVLAFNDPENDSTVSGNTITIGGTANDALTPAGVTVWYVIDGSDTIAAPAGKPTNADPPTLAGWLKTDGSADWYKNAQIPTGGGEGQRYVHVVAFDALGNMSNIEQKRFYVDISPPKIQGFTFTGVAADSGVNFAGKAYGFNFKATDSNAMQSVKVSRDGTELFTATAESDGSGGYTYEIGNTPPYATYTGTGSGSGTGYTYTVTPNSANTEWAVNVNFTGQADKNYTFNIEVKDIAGRENALDNSTNTDATDDYKTFGVRVDTTGPVLTVVDPAANMSATGSKLYISGTAPDALTTDGITAWYVIDENPTIGVPGSPPSGDPLTLAGWILAPGGAFWSHNADLVSGTEGDRYLHVIAYDKRGNASGTDPVHRKFFVDVNPPQIQSLDSLSTGINFSSTPYYAGKNYTIKFNAFDSNTLAGGNPVDSQSLVTITRNGTPLVAGGTQSDGPGIYTLTIDKTTDSTGKTWPVTLALTNQPDGNYSYSIEIRDATGKENTLDNNTGSDLTDDRKSFTLVVDTTPPNTSLTMPPAMVSNEGQDFVVATPSLLLQDNVNGVIEFAASAMDSSGLAGVKWFIVPYGDSSFTPTPANAQTLYGDSRGVEFATNNYTDLYDTTALSTGRYSLYILAEDNAGNVGYNSATACTFYVDQRTDRPVVALTNLAKDGSNDPVVGSGFILRGTVKDDDAVDPAAVKINLFDGSAWYDGSNWISSSPEDLAPTTVTGSGREIGFTYNFPAGMVDGPGRKVVVKAADLPAAKIGSTVPAYDATNAAKDGSTEITFVLDVTPPVIGVDDPIDSTYKAVAASISGTLTEMYLDVFRLRIDAENYVNYIADSNPDAGPLVLTSWASGTGIGNWTYKLPILDAPLSVGLHTITLEAVDKAGLATTVLWRFYVDNEGPVISFRIDEIDYSTWGTVPAGMNILREGGLALRGDFRDDFSAVFTDSFDYRFDEQGSWTTTNSTTASIANPGRNPSWTLNLDNLPAPISGVMPDGPHRVQIRVKDVLGNETTSGWIGFRVDTADPTIVDILPLEADAVFGNVGNPVFTLKGTAADANLSSITLNLNGGTPIPITVPSAATSVAFTYPVTSAAFSLLPQGANRFTITVVDEAGRSKTVEWNFIKDTDPPTIEWSNLNNQTGDNSSLFQDAANLKIMGVARDTNGVHTLTSTIKKYNKLTTAWDTVETNFDLAPGDEGVKNWIKDVADLTVTPLDGLYQITINATDRGGNAATPQTREFRVDLAMPTVAIDTGTGTHPLQLFYNGKATGSGPITVSGTASDANGITGVTAALSGTNAPAWATATAAYNSTQGTWEVTIPHENPGNSSEKLPEGGYTLNVTATDGANRTNTAYGTFTYDSVNPTSAILLPVRYGRVTGAVSIQGSNNDIGSAVAQMQYQFTKNDTSWKDVIFSSEQNAPWQGGLYSWRFGFTSSSTYWTSTYGREVKYDPYTGIVTPEANTGLWEVSFKVRVEDLAGNETIIDDYFLLLDQFGDVPRIVISNPASGSILGGRVFISGTAEDNNYINRIQYRVKANPTLLSNEWDGIDWIGSNNGQFLTGSGVGPNVTWQFDINGLGEYNPTPLEGIKPVLVQVRAVDAPYNDPNNLNGAFSDPVSVLIYFDAGVPRISGERVANRVAGDIPLPPNGPNLDDTNSVAYVDGLQVSKHFVFEASIQDDSGLETIQYWRDGQLNGPNALGTTEVIAPAIKNVTALIAGRKYMIDVVGSADWLALGATSNTHGATFTATGSGTGTGTAYEATVEGEFVYKLRFMVPSDDILQDKTGNYTINIMALDNSSPQLRADRSYTLQVDNFYPFGAYTSPNQAAGWYNIRGTARDFDSTSGPIQGLDKVVVYFSRDGTFIPLHEPDSEVGWDNHPWNPINQEVRNTVSSGQTTVQFPGDRYSGIFIDWDETGAGLDQDLDGYLEGWYDNGADKVWSARFNTLQLKDGPVKVHYVIFDKAGNATYYEYTVFIKNHAPVIKSVNLGTDIFGNKAINGTRLYTTGYFTNPAFVARNQRLSFNVAKIDGNGAARYRITPVTQQSVGVMSIVVGDVYTINTVGSTDWVAMGAADNNVGTTFVATAGGNGDGTAFKYNPIPSAVIKTGDVASGGGNETGNVIFSGTDFANIPDTTSATNAYFLIKIWDTTVSGGAESLQLSDMVVVRLKIENLDSTVPTSRLYDLSPYAKNQSKYDIATTLSNLGPDGIGEDKNMRYGGLYMNNNAISGHVEPRGTGATTNSIFLEDGIPSTFAKDTVSGKVILRGYARDNQRISGIQIKFGNANPIDIIKVRSALYETSTGHFLALEPVSSGAWVYDDLSLDEHLVEWAYEWDTQTTKITTGATITVVGDITVQAISRDAKVGTYSNTSADHTLNPNSSAQVNQSGTNNINYNTIGMTAAPYITSLERGGGYNTLRSKQGWNSFRRSSGTSTLEANEQVVVNGFNLSTSANTGAVVTIPTTGNVNPSQTINKLTFNLADSAKSGVFGLAVSGIQAVNNRNNNNNTWNKESSPTVEGSSLWNDDRNIHVWQTNNANTNANRGYFVGSEKPIHPAMTKHPTSGLLYASWSEYKTSQIHYGTNSAGRTSIFSIYDPPEHTDIHFSMNATNSAANASPTVVYNGNFYSNGGWVNLDTGMLNSGGVYLWDSNAGASSGTNSPSYGYASGGSIYVAETLAHEAMLAQFENERIVTKGNAIHITYYDTDTKSLKYWYNERGTNVTGANYRSNTNVTFGGTNYPNRRWINLDGGFDGNDYVTTWDAATTRVLGITGAGGTSPNAGLTSANITEAKQNATDGNRTGSTAAGEFSAIDLTSQGYPVIAYYDITNQTVKLAYANHAIPLYTTRWQRQDVLTAGDPNYKFSGKYISMKIDTRTGMNNRIHMVFNRASTGNLIYVTGTQATAGGAYTFQPSVVIDSVGNVGKWADISLDANGNPWVSYVDTSRVDSFDGVKMAYCITSNAAGTEVDASATTGLLNPDKWEVMNMATIYNTADKRTSIENWDNIGTGANQQFWSAAIGYAADDFFRIGYYIKP